MHRQEDTAGCEARHIFLRAGMDDYLAAQADAAGSTMPLHILEAGFGTGLNAYLTLLHAEEMQAPVCYHSLEKYPLQPEEVATLNYAEQTGRGNDPLFRALHEAAWEEDVEVTPLFRLHKHRCDFRETDFPPMFDLVFYDAFNPEAQPHLWTEEVFARFHRALLPALSTRKPNPTSGRRKFSPVSTGLCFPTANWSLTA